MNAFKRKPMVAIVGDRGEPLGGHKYEIARQLGALLCEHGFCVITGGLGGIMEAASRGARESPHWQPGTVIALLPGFNPEDANPYSDIVIPTGLDHLRNALIAQADAVIAIGGGAGTLTELALAWMYRRLVIALRVDGWSGKLADQRIDERIRYPDIPDDRVYGADNAAEAVALAHEKLSAYTRRHTGIR